jgi:DNA-binding NarL/FixJ family response regulator
MSERPSTTLPGTAEKIVKSPVPSKTDARNHALDLGNCILLVDDSAVMRRCLRREFEQAGWVVCGEAADGGEAIAMAEQLHPQVILLDLAMPGINGLAAARRLKLLLPEVHLILFTGHGDLFKLGEANRAGISAVFAKGEPITELLDKARSLVSQSAASILH